MIKYKSIRSDLSISISWILVFGLWLLISSCWISPCCNSRIHFLWRTKGLINLDDWRFNWLSLVYSIIINQWILFRFLWPKANQLICRKQPDSYGVAEMIVSISKRWATGFCLAMVLVCLGSGVLLGWCCIGACCRAFSWRCRGESNLTNFHGGQLTHFGMEELIYGLNCILVLDPHSGNSGFLNSWKVQ